MNLNTILKKAWQILWNYRALWLFGAVLALVGPHMIIFKPWSDWQNDDQWTRIKLSDTATLRLPGADITIDLTTPGGFRIINETGITWHEFNDLVDLLDREASIDLWPILIEFAIILGGLLLLGILARYITETALMRMVDETEASRKRLSLWGGLRRGFSRRAGRLFLLDLVIGLVAAVVTTVVFGLAVAPVMLAIGRHDAILITAGVGTLGLLVLAFFVWLVVSIMLSVVLQPIRRAIALEEQSLPASIRQGYLVTRHHLNDILPLWLVWISIRLIWVPLTVPIVFLFVPLLLLTIPLGVALGGFPAAMVTGFTALFMDGITPWILGAMAGLPIFIVVMFSPILFVNGLIEIYLSSIWTLAYRDLKAMELQIQAPASQVQILAAPG
jgi:hypothetical protein